MSEQSESAMVYQRRRFFFIGSVCSLPFTIEGIVMMLGEDRLTGFFLACFFGFGTIVFSAPLFLSDEEVLDLPGNDFYWIAPGQRNERGDSPATQMVSTTPPVPESFSWKSGVWDRELDGCA